MCTVVLRLLRQPFPNHRQAATIISAARMWEMSFGLADEAKAINNAVDKVLDQNYRTTDIMSEGMTKVGCKKMAELIAQNL